MTFASTHGCDIQLDGSFTGTELDFALDVCNGVVDVLGSWAWEMQLRMVDE